MAVFGSCGLSGICCKKESVHLLVLLAARIRKLRIEIVMGTNRDCSQRKYRKVLILLAFSGNFGLSRFRRKEQNQFFK